MPNHSGSFLNRFNPHPREGVTVLVLFGALWMSRFNPHPREGVTGTIRLLVQGREVSIHTPVKG